MHTDGASQFDSTNEDSEHAKNSNEFLCETHMCMRGFVQRRSNGIRFCRYCVAYIQVTIATTTAAKPFDSEILFFFRRRSFCLMLCVCCNFYCYYYLQCASTRRPYSFDTNEPRVVVTTIIGRISHQQNKRTATMAAHTAINMGNTFIVSKRCPILVFHRFRAFGG